MIFRYCQSHIFHPLFLYCINMSLTSKNSPNMHFINFSQNTCFTDTFKFFCIIQVHAKLRSERNSKWCIKQVILHTNLEILDYSDISVGNLPRNSSTLSTPIGHWYWVYLSKACIDLLHDWSYSLKSLITNMEDTMASARTANLQCNLKTVSLKAYIQRDMFIKLKQISSGLMPDIYYFTFYLSQRLGSQV